MPHCPWGPCSGDRKEQEPGLGEQRAESGHAGGRWPRVKGSARPWRLWREDRSLDSRSRPPVFSTWAPGDSICVLPLGAAHRSSARRAPEQAGPPCCVPATPWTRPSHPAGLQRWGLRCGPSAASPVGPPGLGSLFTLARHGSPRHLLTRPLPRCSLIVTGSAARSPQLSPGPVPVPPARSPAPTSPAGFLSVPPRLPVSGPADGRRVLATLWPRVWWLVCPQCPKSCWQ